MAQCPEFWAEWGLCGKWAREFFLRNTPYITSSKSRLYKSNDVMPEGRKPRSHTYSQPGCSEFLYWHKRAPTTVKRLSKREKLRGDRIVRFENLCVWLRRRLRLLVSYKRNFLFTSMKFIGDDREEEEELMTWIISMLKYAFVLIFPDCFLH